MQHAATPIVEFTRAPLFPPLRSLAVSLLGWAGMLVCALAIAGVAVGSARIAHASVAADTLYGTNWDRIATVDQNGGSISPLPPQPGSVFFALAFDSTGRLFAAGCTDSVYPDLCGALEDRLLMELDPLTGEIVDFIGPLADESGVPLPIRTLSVQPETDVLFGFESSPYASRQRIWTIDKSTAAATPVASEIPAGCETHCSWGLAFAFAPDGTLYHFITSTRVFLRLRS
jgi:hypothetical protein